jgi:IS30 family transposase
MTEGLIDLINDKLRLKWSPEQISGWLLVEQKISLSHERIYQHVWADKASGGDLYKYLRREAKKYKARGSNGKTASGQIKNRISIDDRPDIVDEKSRIGDWEIDTVIGRNHSGALVTIVERATMFTVSKRVKSKRAEEVTAATIALLRPFKALVHTITADNGKEFAYHEKISASLECDFYFAHPYHSWERGLNENTNGLLRQYFPKSTDFKKVSEKEVAQSVEQLNNRPRKTLAFKTPAFLMQQEMAASAV